MKKNNKTYISSIITERNTLKVLYFMRFPIKSIVSVQTHSLIFNENKIKITLVYNKIFIPLKSVR